MRLPWVSREQYDTMREFLEKQLADERAERRDILDYLQVQSLGRPIFATLPIENHAKQPEARSSSDIPPADPDSFTDDVQRARAAGYVKPRAIAAYISKLSEERRDKRIREQSFAVGHGPSPKRSNPDFEQDIRDGEAAAMAAMQAQPAADPEQK